LKKAWFWSLSFWGALACGEFDLKAEPKRDVYEHADGGQTASFQGESSALEEHVRRLHPQVEEVEDTSDTSEGLHVEGVAEKASQELDQLKSFFTENARQAFNTLESFFTEKVGQTFDTLKSFVVEKVEEALDTFKIANKGKEEVDKTKSEFEGVTFSSLPSDVHTLIIQNALREAPEAIGNFFSVRPLAVNIKNALSRSLLGEILIKQTRLDLQVDTLNTRHQFRTFFHPTLRVDILLSKYWMSYFQARAPQTPAIQEFMERLSEAALPFSVGHTIVSNLANDLGNGLFKLFRSEDRHLLARCWEEHPAFGPFIATMQNGSNDTNNDFQRFYPYESNHPEIIPSDFKNFLQTYRLDDQFLRANPKIALLADMMRAIRQSGIQNRHDESPLRVRDFTLPFNLGNDIRTGLYRVSTEIKSAKHPMAAEISDAYFRYFELGEELPLEVFQELILSGGTEATSVDRRAILEEQRVFSAQKLVPYPELKAVFDLFLDGVEREVSVLSALQPWQLSTESREKIVEEIKLRSLSDEATRYAFLLLTNTNLRTYVAPLVRLLSELCDIPLSDEPSEA